MLLKRGPAKLYGVIKYGMHLCRSRFYTKRSERRMMLYSILEEFLYRLCTNDILEHAYGLAFNFTLAIFPATIFVFTLIPYIPIPGLELKILFLLKEIMPESVYEALIPTIQDTVSKQRSGLLSFGFITTLYLATNGMMSLVKTFNRSDKEVIPNQRGYFKQRAIATLLTLALALVLFCTIMLLIVVRQVLDYMISYGLIASRFKINLILGSRLVIVFFMFFMTISGIYYLAPATKKYWPFISLGSLVATTSSLLASLGFSYYVNNFANYNRFYGSLGVMIALMVWLFLLSVILLVGFELNASINKVASKAGEGLAHK